MMGCAFMEIRTLARPGKEDQVGALGHAFHNLPRMLASGEVDWRHLRSSLAHYQSRYPREYGSRYDYLFMLNLVDRSALAPSGEGKGGASTDATGSEVFKTDG